MDAVFVSFPGDKSVSAGQGKSLVIGTGAVSGELQSKFSTRGKACLSKHIPQAGPGAIIVRER